MQERSEGGDVPYGHASMLLFGEENEATEPYNKNAEIVPKTFQLKIQLNFGV